MSEEKYLVIRFDNAEKAAAFLNGVRERNWYTNARQLNTDEYPTKRYSGWTNYETWAVKLWIDSEKSNQDYWREAAQAEWNPAIANEILTREQRTLYNLADRLKDEHEEGTTAEAIGDAIAGTVYSALLSAALSNVNWSEIAESLLDEVDKTQDEEEEAEEIKP